MDVSSFAIGMYVNGSFVTDSLGPSDVDIILLLPPGFSASSSAGRTLHAVQQRAARWEWDLFPVEENSFWHHYWLDFFTHDRQGNEKGIVYMEFKND